MRRIVLILGGLLAIAALVATSASGDGDGGGDYQVRAYFDNAGFLVHGEDVRIAGATVGSVAEVDVSREGEAVTEDGSEMPGKAVAVLSIDDPGFQDFRTDASCLIRPQSLLGEKYVECVPTQPRAAGSEPPPELSVIPDGDIGAGQYRLPLENNGKQVDLDLINNITREPEAERLRLILNDLGAGLAARGDDLAEVIRRADPALQETDKVLAILAAQNHGLAQLAADSDQILTPLAREREHVAGFIRNASIAGAAAAERRDDIAEGFRRFPPALQELQSTMVELRRFADQAQPVAVNLREAAPGLAGATRALGPFARAGVPALRSLGKAAAASGPDIAASSPVIRDLRKLGLSTTPTARSLRKLLSSLRKTKGVDQLMHFLVNTSGVFNGFDDYGHYLRAAILITNCIDYVTFPISGCGANFSGGLTTASATAPSPEPTKETLAGPPGSPDPLDGAFGAKGKKQPDAKGEATAPGFDAAENGTNDLLEFLVGDGR
jgi:phospholipid/cholesterol/gamma-HCH transport system substrate-binding protein